VNFLIDNQLPPALARFIESELKAKAIHVADLGLRDASDAEVWRYASTNDLILISKDEGFRQHDFESTDGQADLGASRQLP
jgi:predicted nuclease of predicted toxin-antitoxin system